VVLNLMVACRTLTTVNVCNKLEMEGALPFLERKGEIE